MKTKRIKRVMAFLLCTVFLMQNNEVRTTITLFAEAAEWDKDAAIYWNPGGSLPYYDGGSDLATRSNALGKIPKGSDRANGLSPDKAVKSFNTAIARAEKLCRQMDIEMADVVIYAMNPMIIPQGKSCTVSGKEVTVVPWEGRRKDEKPIFIVDGGTLLLDNIILQTEYNGSPEESTLIYISSGTVRLGEQAEVNGKFVLDYTQAENDPSEVGASDANGSVASASDANGSVASASDADSLPEAAGREPVLELTDRFDLAEANCTLELRIPEDRERDVTAVKALHKTPMSEDDFLAAFTVSKTTEDWEILAESRTGGFFHDIASTVLDADVIFSDAVVAYASVSDASVSNAGQGREQSTTGDEQETVLTQKSLIARRIPGIIHGSQIGGRLWLDRNFNGVMEKNEQGISDYSVGLFAADDRSTVVQTVKTQADGTYQFQALKPGSYAVGIISETIDAKRYLLPEVGITKDNKFEMAEISGEWVAAYSEETVMAAFSGTIVISAAVTVSESIDAGLHLGLNRSQFNTEYLYLPLGGNTLNSGDETKLVVMAADGDPDAGYYKAYAANAAGLREALYDLYLEDAAEANYIMYLGGDIALTGTQAGTIFANTASSSGTANVSFASLRGRLNTIVITGCKDDDVTNIPATAAPSSCRLLSLSGSGERYFGSNIILRNIRHTFGAGTGSSYGVYMNGYGLTLGGNSWQTNATRYFGGGRSGMVTPSGGAASITVYSTGTGASHFIGGMRAGTLDGNAEITIHNTSGNAISVWGGGLGPSSSSPAYITGSVTNNITGMSTRSGSNSSNGLTSFVGGLNYGTVSGRITNMIHGSGRFTSGTNYFIGGSQHGNIGTDSALRKAERITKLSDLDPDDYIIRNNIDFSDFTYGTTCYIGTNQEAGIVKGNVINIVKAGNSSGGGLTNFSGGSGSSTAIGGNWQNTFRVNTSTAEVTNIEEGLAAARNRSSYQLYGNITSELRGGCAVPSSNYWFRGAGWGYVEGNVYSELGTEDLVYKSNYGSYQYSTTINNQGNRTNLDLVGGGGGTDDNNSFCIKGDTTLVMKEIVARWTYGGSFGGVQIGNSKISLYGGVVDTCEGTGYRSYIHVGDGRAEVHGGQVDWFLSGGGWSDDYQNGNVSVEVFDAPNVIINASMGGTYGASSNHAISGDSTIVVYGGNFSGQARTGVRRGFSAGPSNNGSILGNASVTIDLRGNQHGFSIAPRDHISGGRRVDADTSTYLGTDAKNTISLNIMTDEAQTDLLNGLDIYGDCTGTTGTIGNTRAGKITINVNAPGANIGNLYATDYSNISGSGQNAALRRDVEINLVSAETLTGLCSGNGTENITNSVARASETAGRRAVINIGPQSADPDHILGERESGETVDGLPHRINISTDGIIGFTAMSIQKRLLVAQSGSIKNGANATVGNHGTTYQDFGTLALQAGEGMNASGLGITSASAVFIAGAATVEGEGEVYIQSTGQANQVIFTDLVIPGASWVTWLKVGNVIAETTLQTNWFGVSTGWRVITLSPDKTKAREKITPINFRGLEEAAGKSFIGDSDTHFSGNYGYAVAILGSVYTWEVVEGNGMVSHNVPVSTTAPALGETLKAYGTVPADTPSTEGSFAVPSSLIPDPVAYPEFKFIPDAESNECVNYVSIRGSDHYVSSTPHNYQIDRGEMYQIKTWTASGDNNDKEYSFDITASFDKGDVNQSKVTVSKQAAGDYIDKTREFAFTIYFWDSDGNALTEGTRIICTGTHLPEGSVLVLDSEGKAEFRLKHEQQITIGAPRASGQIRIVETVDPHYSTSYTDSSTEDVVNSGDTGIVRLETTDRSFRFTNTRIRTAVYVDGINGSDENSGFVPTEPVRGLAKAYEQLELSAANVIYVVGTVRISESAAITAEGYTADAMKVVLSAPADHLEIRRFATPLAGDPNAGVLYSDKYDEEDFLGSLFKIENGVDFTIGEGVRFDGHYYPKSGEESTPEFSVNRYIEVLSPLIQAESGAELTLLEGVQLKDNFNTKEPADGEIRVEGGAVYNSGKVKLCGAEILNNSGAKGAGIYQNGIFEIALNPYGVEGQEIYLTTVNLGSETEPVWEDHTITTAVWLPENLKLDINMDHAAAGRPVVKYTVHTEADSQWGNYTLGETVPETLFLVENEADSSLLELQDWKVIDISIPDEIYLVVQQGRHEAIDVKKADGSDFILDSPFYKVKNGGSYETRVLLTGFMNQNASVGIHAYERMNLVGSPSDAAGDTADKADLYLAIKGIDDDGGGFGSLPETSLHDFNEEGGKRQEMGILGSGEEAGFVFTGTASDSFMTYYLDRLFPFSATADDRIAHFRNKDQETGEISANYARAMFKMTYCVELVR